MTTIHMQPASLKYIILRRSKTLTETSFPERLNEIKHNLYKNIIFFEIFFAFYSEPSLCTITKIFMHDFARYHFFLCTRAKWAKFLFAPDQKTLHCAQKKAWQDKFYKKLHGWRFRGGEFLGLSCSLPAWLFSQHHDKVPYMFSL